MLQQVIEAEVETFVAAHAEHEDERGRRRVVRNGHAPEREIQTEIGPIAVRRPKVRDRGIGSAREQIRFTSKVLPPFLRRTRNVEELLPPPRPVGRVSCRDQMKGLLAFHGSTCLIKDREALLAFYDFPAEHWKHLRTSNPIESTFATVRLRTDKTKGCLSRDTALAMVLKLAKSAERQWRKLDGANRLGQLIEGVRFRNCEPIKDAEDIAAA